MRSRCADGGQSRRTRATRPGGDIREHPLVTSQGSAYKRFRRALDRGNITEALSAASELGFVGLNEALELAPSDKMTEGA
jgi:hypothetical protein